MLDAANAKTCDDAESPCWGIPIELEWSRQFRGHEDAWLARNPQLRFRRTSVPELTTANDPGSDLAEHAWKHGPRAIVWYHGWAAVNGLNT